MSERESQFDIDNSFLDRWSPRSFDEDYIMEKKELEKLIEAARWSPSCFNEQPWRFHYTIRNESGFGEPLSWLVEANQEWAKRSSALLFLVAKKTFEKNSKPNKHSWFDSGAAWMALALQARKEDLYAHAMAGIKEEMIHDQLQLSSDLQVVCAIAIGKKSKPEILSDDLQKNEQPNERRPLSEIAFSI